MQIALPRALQHPARIVPLAFLAAIAAGTALLVLPVSRPGPDGAPLLVALFTATSAACITGLAVVDTSSYWSPFGQSVILVLMQLGGFGILTLASLLGLVVSHRIGLRSRLLAQQEIGTVGLGDVRRLVRGVAVVMFTCEGLAAAVLTLRLFLGYDEPLGRALWHGVFHGVSAFTNAGFALYQDSFVRFVSDPWVCLPVFLAVLAGSLGFPVLYEVRHEWRRPADWSIHTKLTVGTSVLLLPIMMAALLVFEWRNPRTFGSLDLGTKWLAALFQSIQPRSGGLNSVDFGAMREETWAVTDAMMFIGGGSASTAGGIKVTTFALLGYVIFAEIRGEPDVVVAQRRVAGSTQRLALSIALLGVGVTGVATLIVLSVSGFPLGQVLFEVTSAFGTVGLSTGITADLPPSAQVVLVVLMFVGRVGIVVAASALALRSRSRLYRRPEERPLVG